MGFLDKIAFWRKPKKIETNSSPAAKVDTPTEPTEELTEATPLTEEEQQLLQIKNFIKSDDISNHQLAAMFMQSLDIEWEVEEYLLVGSSAEKMTFWAGENIAGFCDYYKELVIGKTFFSQYSEIAAFAEILPLFDQLEVLRWEAGPYWNQHPILSAAAKLPKLKKLYAENCKMHYLPEDLCHSKSLKELYLGQNKLQELPASLSLLQTLQKLDLSNNQLKRYPSVISKLKKLEILRLPLNPLTDIEPRLLGRLYKLNDLELPDNLAKFYVERLKNWLPDVDFDKPYWDFD